MTIEYALLVTAVLLLLSVLASRASSRFGIPALLLFLLVGMLAGSDGPGGIYFDNAQATQSLGVVALTLILFSGGLDTNWPTVRPALRGALSLSTIGIGISAILVGWFATVALGFRCWKAFCSAQSYHPPMQQRCFQCCGRAACGSRARLSRCWSFSWAAMIPWQCFHHWPDKLAHSTGHVDGRAGAQVALQMALGAAAGYGFGRLMPIAINRVHLQVEGLYPVLTVAMVLFIYGATALLGGNGFLAVYIAALVLGNSNFVHKRSLLRFHDGLAWLMQIAMFLTLGLLVFPSQLADIAGVGMIMAVFLVFVARPVSVFASLLFARLRPADKLMVCGLGCVARCQSFSRPFRCWPASPTRIPCSTWYSSSCWCLCCYKVPRCRL